MRSITRAIFLPVSARIALFAVGAALTLASPSAATAGVPSPSQISTAIQKAEHSKQLWATVNVCTTNHHNGELGIRGQIPSLGFASEMYMTFEVTYEPSGGKRFKPLPSTKATVPVGQASHKVLQLGRTYPFKTSRALLAGRVTFEWRRSGKLLGRTTRRTTGHHTHVDFADPRGFSQAFCRLS
jgi:hypothetical protein